MNEAKLVDNLPLSDDLKPIKIGEDTTPISLSKSAVKLDNLSTSGVNESGEFFGIGTLAPKKVLEVKDEITQAYDPSDAFPNQTLDINNSGAVSGQYVSLCLRNTNTASGTKNSYTFLNSVSNATGDHSTNFTVGLREAGGDVNEKFRVQSDGNVGIGTTSPSDLLHIKNGASSGPFHSDSMLTLEHSSNIGIQLSGTGTQAIFDVAGSQVLRIDSSGNVGIGTTDPDYKLDVVGDARIGWHGSSTRVKILHSDFIPDDGGRPVMIDDTGSDRWIESDRTSSMYASVPIPTGYTATHVNIYGSATSAITVYEADINSKTVTSKGTGNIGTEIDITDVDSDTTNYILIQLAQANGEEVYGGYMTITPI